MIPVPIFDLETRRKKESIAVRQAKEEGAGALGGWVARIKPRR